MQIHLLVVSLALEEKGKKIPTCSSWMARPHRGCIEIEAKTTWKQMGQVDAADWKLLDQFVGFWWCAVCSSGTPT